MYKRNPYIYVRVKCSGRWSGTVQEVCENEPRAFNSKKELTELINEYASKELYLDYSTSLDMKYDHWALKIDAKNKRNIIGCWVEIMYAQRETWQGRFRHKGVVKFFKNGWELFNLINERYLRMQYLQDNSIENRSAKK